MSDLPSLPELRASHPFDVRFSEVDAMQIVWHGAYPLYFEDAREAFGARYGLEYMTIAREGCYVPLVDLTFRYLRPIRYETKCRVDIIYRPTASAKIVFDYEIRAVDDETLLATGHSVQAFMDRDYNLLWYKPEFFVRWEERWGIFTDRLPL